MILENRLIALEVERVLKLALPSIPSSKVTVDFEDRPAEKYRKAVTLLKIAIDGQHRIVGEIYKEHRELGIDEFSRKKIIGPLRAVGIKFVGDEPCGMRPGTKCIVTKAPSTIAHVLGRPVIVVDEKGYDIMSDEFSNAYVTVEFTDGRLFSISQDKDYVSYSFPRDCLTELVEIGRDYLLSGESETNEQLMAISPVIWGIWRTGMDARKQCVRVMEHKQRSDAAIRSEA